MSIAFVVPVHTPKFGLFCSLVHSNVKYSNALFGVFSSVHEQRACPCAANVSALVIEPDKRNAVTSKKWKAVKHVFDHHTFDAVVAMDAESKFRRCARSQDVDDFTKGIVSYGSRPAVGVFKTINHHSCMAAKVSVPFDGAYLWWGNIPMYTRDNFYEFYDSVATLTHL